MFELVIGTLVLGAIALALRECQSDEGLDEFLLDMERVSLLETSVYDTPPYTDHDFEKRRGAKRPGAYSAARSARQKGLGQTRLIDAGSSYDSSTSTEMNTPHLASFYSPE